MKDRWAGLSSQANEIRNISPNATTVLSFLRSAGLSLHIHTLTGAEPNRIKKLVYHLLMLNAACCLLPAPSHRPWSGYIYGAWTHSNVVHTHPYCCLLAPSLHLPWSGYMGVDSNMSEVAPFTSGPYTMYECPVIHPTSATQAKTSPSSSPKACLVVMPVYSRYPAVVCATPFGLPVDPDV